MAFTTGKKPNMGLTPSRKVCMEALLDVAQSGAYSALALDKRLRESGLSPLDKRFTTELFYGTIERRLLLDYVLSRFMEHPMEDTVAREILRMGVYQILFMDSVPDFAACNQQVEMMRTFHKDTLCPLANGILRKVSSQKSEIAYPTEPMERLAVLYSCPQWLVEKLVEWLGDKNAEAFLAYKPRKDVLYACPNLLTGSDGTFRTFLSQNNVSYSEPRVEHIFPVTGLRTAHPAFLKGQFTVIGEASAMAVMATGVKGGMQVLDACAAPGGKACYMAELMNGTGRVHAFELHEHRVKLIAAYAKRMGLDTVRARQQDAAEPVEAMVNTMDVVLVDAPCSGIGVIHEKPDIKYNLTPEDLAALPDTQAKILNTCASYVKAGGTLVYSTCTINPSENQQIVTDFLARHKEFKLAGLEKRLPQAFHSAIEDGMMTLYPHVNGTDGFFIARMEKGRAPR